MEMKSESTTASGSCFSGMGAFGARAGICGTVCGMFSARFKWDLETNQLAQTLAEKKEQGAPILDLTESNPTRAGFDYPASEILPALADPGALLYEPQPQGLLSARKAVADYYHSRGETVAPEDIFLSASTSEAYAWLFKLLADQGDEILIPQPGYPLCDFLAALEGLALRPYELAWTPQNGWRIDFDSIIRAITPRTRAIIIITPNNPTGSFIRPAELETLTEICAARQLALIVDEVFADYALDPATGGAIPLTADSPALKFVLNGLSKTLALPQLKLGWIITSGPERLKREAIARLELIADTFLSVNTPVQQALPELMKLRGKLQSQILNRVRGNYEWLGETLKPSPCRLLKIQGGWSAVIEAPRFHSEEEWVIRLLAEDNVLAHPGYFFDFNREAFLILSLLAPPSVFREGVSRLQQKL